MKRIVTTEVSSETFQCHNGFQSFLWLRSQWCLVSSILTMAFVLSCSGFAIAQSSGTQDNVRFTQGDVNESATLSLGVPLGKYRGRGLDLPVSLSYSSNVWRIDHINSVRNYEVSPPYYIPQTVTRAIYAEYSAAGWQSSLDLPKIQFPKSSDSYSYKGQDSLPYNYPGCYGFRIARVWIHMPDGSTHELRKSDAAVQGGSNVDMVGTFYAVDGSRMRYDSTGSDTGTLYVSDGTRYVLGHPLSYIIDRNNNTQTFDETTRQWTDTLGRVIVNPLPPTTPDQPQEYSYNLPGLNGTLLPYTFKWKNLSQVLTQEVGQPQPSLKYMASHYLPLNETSPNSPPSDSTQANFPRPQSTQYESLFHSEFPWNPDEEYTVPTLVVGKGALGTGGRLFDPVVLAEIVLPDGTSYKFTYNNYGELDKIVYPTGAYEKYEYAASSLDVDQDQQPYIQARRKITSRKLSVNGQGNDILEWKYLENVGLTVDDNPTANIRFRRISIIAPDKTRTEFYKYDPTPNNGQGRPYWTFGLADAREGLVFQKKIYSTSPDGLGGQLLRREITQYEQTNNNYQFSTVCGQTPFTRSVNAYRNARPTKHVSILFEGSGPALAQTETYVYDTTNQLTTGLDQTQAYAYHYAVVDNNTAQTGKIDQIPQGNLARYTETTYLNDSIYRNRNILGLSLTSKIWDGAGNIASQSEMRYDEAGYTPEVGRALPTSSRVWDSTKGSATDTNAYLTTHAKFDVYGNQIEATDAEGNTTVTEYDATYQTFPVKTRAPIPDPTPSQNPDGQPHGSQTALESTANYDYTAGLVLSTTDVNGQVTQMEYNDPFLRLTRVIPPTDGAQVITEYGLGTTEATRYVKVKRQINAGNWREATTFYDGVGRTVKTQLKDVNGDVFTETQYDNMGRVQQVTNPYRASENIFWTLTGYDDLGRVIKVTTPDGAQVQTSYSLSTTGVIGAIKTNMDQAGRKRSGITDALGKMVRVIEDPDGQNLVTDYVFDTLGNLRKTTQGEQSRYFLTDSLGRVLYSKQPEQEVNASFNATDSLTGNTQWAMKFTYDANGNILSKTDANGVSVSVIYDHLKRPIYRDYSNATPDVSFFYDGTGLGQVPSNSKGQTTKVSSSVSESRYTAFDSLGRIKSSQQITNGLTYNFPDYSYDLAGNLTSRTYPSGRVVKNTLDENGDLATVESRKNIDSPLTVYLDQIKYTASGDVKESRLGNGLWETTAYNSRLQVKQIGLGNSNTDSSLLKIEYGYGAALQNNGALREQKISNSSLTQPIVQSYDYDNLNRLQSSVETYNGGTQSWKQTFSYDRFGNRRFDAANTTTINPSLGSKFTNPLINTSDNRLKKDQDGDSIIDFGYDKAGNLTLDVESQRFVYDAENRQTKFFSRTNTTSTPDATYYYDGEGKRVRKISGQVETVFVYDASGQLVAEYSNQLATTARVSYLTADHLGSPRIITDKNRVVVSRHDYMGFGEEVYAGYANRPQVPGYGVGDGIRKQFTGYERDTESGLDYAQARYYNSQHGRFTSIDPLIASATIRNPQTFNRYSYVLNSPYKFTDPLGLFGICPGGGQGGQGGMPLGNYSWTPLGRTTAPPPPSPNTTPTTPDTSNGQQNIQTPRSVIEFATQSERSATDPATREPVVVILPKAATKVLGQVGADAYAVEFNEDTRLMNVAKNGTVTTFSTDNSVSGTDEESKSSERGVELSTTPGLTNKDGQSTGSSGTMANSLGTQNDNGLAPANAYNAKLSSISNNASNTLEGMKASYRDSNGKIHPLTITRGYARSVVNAVMAYAKGRGALDAVESFPK